MKLFIFILFIAAFLQTSFIPLNLCLLILISRSYSVNESGNYYLALISGILLGILTPFNTGFYAIIFVTSVFLIRMIRMLPITGRFFTIIPVTFVLATAVIFIENLVYQVTFSIWYPIISCLLVLPIFWAVKEWEERFVAKPGIKLRV